MQKWILEGLIVGMASAVIGGGASMLITGGNFTGYIKRFSDRCKRLSLLPTNAYFAILDLEDTQAKNLSQLWKFTVVNQDGLARLIQSFSQKS